MQGDVAAQKRDERADQLEAEAPTFYANTLAVGVSPYDVTLMFGLRAGPTPTPQARIMMSLEHAVVMTMIMRRTLRELAKQEGIEPTVPKKVMRDLQLDEEEPLW